MNSNLRYSGSKKSIMKLHKPTKPEVVTQALDIFDASHVVDSKSLARSDDSFLKGLYLKYHDLRLIMSCND